jgi:hypothetical protein
LDEACWRCGIAAMIFWFGRVTGHERRVFEEVGVHREVGEDH